MSQWWLPGRSESELLDRVRRRAVRIRTRRRLAATGVGAAVAAIAIALPVAFAGSGAGRVDTAAIGSSTVVRHSPVSHPHVGRGGDAATTLSSPSSAAGVQAPQHDGQRSAGGASGRAASAYPAAGPEVLESISPREGPLAGGTTVTITGQHLSDVTKVLFGGPPSASFTIVSDTEIQAVSPPMATDAYGDGHTVPIHVENARNQMEWSSGENCSDPENQECSTHFSYLATPKVADVHPMHGLTAGGTTVKVYGSGFKLDGGAAPGLTVFFGSNPATDVRLFSGGVSCPDDGNASCEELTVTSPPGDIGTVDVIVQTDGGRSPRTSADEFTYY